MHEAGQLKSSHVLLGDSLKFAFTFYVYIVGLECIALIHVMSS